MSLISAEPMSPIRGWKELAAGLEREAALLSALSPAEQMVAVYVAQGFSNREIAAALGKSESTVKHQVGACLRKLGVRTRGRLIALLR